MASIWTCTAPSRGSIVAGPMHCAHLAHVHRQLNPSTTTGSFRVPFCPWQGGLVDQIDGSSAPSAVANMKVRGQDVLCTLRGSHVIQCHGISGYRPCRGRDASRDGRRWGDRTRVAGLDAGVHVDDGPPLHVVAFWWATAMKPAASISSSTKVWAGAGRASAWPPAVPCIVPDGRASKLLFRANTKHFWLVSHCCRVSWPIHLVLL
mmetsp:Transcript_31467/g.57144  ORF Transcript_31467/g.57144 Transcript_31467/m.57144 type:complete len:206 (-) Transcript_31467:311-928(-)